MPHISEVEYAEIYSNQPHSSQLDNCEFVPLACVICFLSPTTSDFELHEVHMEKREKVRRKSHSRVVLKRVNKRRRMEKKVYYKADGGGGGGGCELCRGVTAKSTFLVFLLLHFSRAVLCLRDESIKKRAAKTTFCP